MRPPGSAAELERRRRRAERLLAQGFTQAEVSRRTGASPSSVHRWKTALDEHGTHGLDSRPHPGPRPKLTDAQKSTLLGLLAQGARAHGWSTDLWTTQRIADLAERHFGVSYHRDHIGRLLHSLGWSFQRPTRRARQRDERQIARWLREDWPRVKKTPGGAGRTSSSSTSRASRSRRR